MSDYLFGMPSKAHLLLWVILCLNYTGTFYFYFFKFRTADTFLVNEKTNFIIMATSESLTLTTFHNCQGRN